MTVTQVPLYIYIGSCTVIYDDSLEVKIIYFHVVEWLPCSRRAKHFIPIDSTPATTKKNPSPKYYQSSEHLIKALYADDATLISDCLETRTCYGTAASGSEGY